MPFKDSLPNNTNITGAAFILKLMLQEGGPYVEDLLQK